MSVKRLLIGDNYLKLNKDVVRNYGYDFAHLLDELCYESDYWESNGLLIDGFFYSTVKNLENKTWIPEKRQRKAVEEMQKIGFLEIKLKGLPKKRFFKIDEEKLFKFLQKISNTSEPIRKSWIETTEEVTGSNPTNWRICTGQNDRQITLNKITLDSITRKSNKLNNKDCEIYKDREKKKKKEKKEKEKPCRANATTVCTDSTNNKLPYKEIIDYLNSKTGSNYKATTKKTQKLINARFNEGFNLQDFYTVIDKKTLDWLRDEKMSKFLRPETLFGNKFEGYLNQKKRQLTTGDLNYSMNDFNDFIDFNSFPTYNKGDENKK